MKTIGRIGLRLEPPPHPVPFGDRWVSRKENATDCAVAYLAGVVSALAFGWVWLTL